MCPTLCDPMDRSLLCSSVHGIFQARILAGCHFLLQGIFPTQGSNPGPLRLLYCTQTFFFKSLCHKSLPLAFNQVISHIREKAGTMIYELKDKCMTIIFSWSSAVLKYKSRKLFQGILNHNGEVGLPFTNYTFQEKSAAHL